MKTEIKPYQIKNYPFGQISDSIYRIEVFGIFEVYVPFHLLFFDLQIHI